MNERILLTGGTGFIGNAILKEAVNRGHHVLVLVRDSSRATNIPCHHSNIYLTEGTLEKPRWDDIKSFSPTICVHSAWISTPGIYLESPANRDYLEWSQKFITIGHSVGIRHSIILGTCIEYEISDQKLDEFTSKVSPQSLYARCKNELREFLESERIEHCWGRLFYPYGPGEHPLRLCSSIIRRLMDGDEIKLNTPDSKKDYIFISDIGSAIIRLLERHYNGPINIATGEETTVKRIANELGALLRRSDLVKDAEEKCTDPFPYVVANSSRLRSLGWKPKVSITEGLKSLIEQISQPAR